MKGIVREFGMGMCTLRYLKWITNKDLLYGMGNSAQCYVAAWMGGEFGGEWIRVYTHTQKSLSRVRLFATPWIVAHQAPRSMGFSRHEYWSGLPFPSPSSSIVVCLNPLTASSGDDRPLLCTTQRLLETICVPLRSQRKAPAPLYLVESGHRSIGFWYQMG